MYVKQKSSFRNTDLFINWFTEHFLKHRVSGRVIILLDGHRVYCSSLLLLQTAVENNVTIIHVPGNHTYTLQHFLSVCFFFGGGGAFKS